MFIRYFKKLFTLLFILLILRMDVSAEVGTGGVTLPILNYIAGTRALGLGTAYTALSDDVTSLYWNPAGLARLSRQQVYGLYEKLFEGSTYWFGGYSIPFPGIGVFGLGMIFLNTGDIEGYNPVGETTGVYSESQSMIILSYGTPLDNIKKFNSKHYRFLDFGASIKIIRHSLQDYSSMGIGMDIGVKYIPLKTTKVLRDFIFGMVIQNVLPPSLNLKSEREWYPLKIKLGTCYRTMFDTLFITLDMNQILFRQQSPEFNAGVEYWVLKIFRLRAGYKTGITAGMGMEIDDFSFDYGLNNNSEWGLIHQFSASVRFGKPRFR